MQSLASREHIVWTEVAVVGVYVGLAMLGVTKMAVRITGSGMCMAFIGGCGEISSGCRMLFGDIW